MKKIKLNNGVEMPSVGFGVYQIDDKEVCEQSVLNALKCGYRLIDTAAIYCNEEAVGKAVKKSGIAREEIFITTKAWIQEDGLNDTPKTFEKSLKRLGVDYIDLYLTHQPFGDLYGTWRAMEKLYKEGKIRAIGVCNLLPEKLVDLTVHNEIPPAVCQIETHPFFQQIEMQKILKEFDIALESWAPLDQAKNNIFSNNLLLDIAKKHNKSAAQVILRWLNQRGIIVIPRSVHKERIEENFNIFDFSLDNEDMEKISTLDTKKSSFFSYSDPAIAKTLGACKFNG